MTLSLGDRLNQALFRHLDRAPLGIYVDPFMLAQLKMERDAHSGRPILNLGNCDGEVEYFFDRLRLHPSTRPGAWLIVEPKGNLPREILLVEGQAPAADF